MSIARCLEINARLRAAGVTVHEWAGWQSRGNGQTSAYEGGIIHHTASSYGFAYQTLVTGRAGLAGPLCNYAGNEDGSLTVIAAHPANHAGASGGHSMGPLPVTTLFNKRVLGLEIVYPGTSPMRDAQYRSALLWSRIVTDVCGLRDIQRARAHAETSITGKWDPGDAPGRTINMLAFRTAAAIIGAPIPIPPAEDDDMSMNVELYPATDPETPGRKYKALPGPAKDPGTRVYTHTGHDNQCQLRVWFEAEGSNRYLGPGGGDGTLITIKPDSPGWFPVPAGAIALSFEWTTTEELPVDLEIKFVPQT